ncbi:HAD-IB family hydrolase [Micromonospora sp. S4605]|uniref:HAD-IB family hydrolase n=1 Tax=Micromonospora sp. S4605 TaxID=1420897 RepID=UPI000D6EBB84|nr:HAD-IB family hydrolase [Micromonospora sp. S4605]PWU56759.1 HAD-IB family hydrolase [Micromonospora sp. S4605]
MDDVPPATPLAGAHVLLTGSTGFLGQAVLERLLCSYPDTRVSLLIRGRGSRSAADRLAGLLRKPVFAHWREQVGEKVVRDAVASRVRVVDAALGHADAALSLPHDLDVVVHAASIVSFGPPVDEAFRTNVSGAVQLYEAVRSAGAAPHVVHVSTAYVAGGHKGVVPEVALEHTVDWRTELAAALAAPAEVERDSRRPELLSRLLAEARREHGRSGPQSTAAAAERARVEWLRDRLVDYGRLRARTLGWPDVYTFTKALGERVAEDLVGDTLPLSVVRPAIVESALAHPRPGWIDGLKMTDPLILAYGRGILPEFPGLPDGVLDLVPVDIVVNAILAVAAVPPPAASPAYYHVGSGARNPLTFRDMYDTVRQYFTEHPMPDGDRGDVRVPTWDFPGSRRVGRMLRAGERALNAAQSALLAAPATDRTRDWQDRLTRRRADLDFLRRYADLYGVYTETEVVYTDDRLLALHRALPLERAAEHGFDVAAIDWPHYLRRVHIPAITASLRRTPANRRADRRLPAVTNGDRDVIALFDLEGTLVASNVVEGYLWARLADLPARHWPGELVDLVGRLPGYLAAERRDRGEFLRRFLRRYAGASEALLHRLVDERLGDALLRRAHPEAVRRVREHRAAGHRTVLVTGTVDVLVRPLAPLFDEVVASGLHLRDGVYSGLLDAPPLVGEARAAWLRRYARTAGARLEHCYAYGDSYSDRPLLEAVGQPVAVNPDPQLYRYARSRGWPVARWAAGTLPALDALTETVR